MKKIILSLSALIVFGLTACDTKEKMTDTNGAVPAKVVDNVTETEIVVLEDSLPTVAESLEEATDAQQAATQQEEVKATEKAKDTQKEAASATTDEEAED